MAPQVGPITRQADIRAHDVKIKRVSFGAVYGERDTSGMRLRWKGDREGEGRGEGRKRGDGGRREESGRKEEESYRESREGSGTLGIQERSGVKSEIRWLMRDA